MAGKVEELEEFGLGMCEEAVEGCRSDNVVGPVEVGVHRGPGIEVEEAVESVGIKLCVDFCKYAGVDSSKEVISTNDLVWGKVRTHPWWPGQIVDSSAASAIARKYFKPGCLLVAFFGDQSFAWSEVSRLRPFGQWFLHLEKEASSWDCRYAVHCALDEVSRRVEFGLACSCTPEYDKIKMQIIVNAGVRDGYTRCYVRDSFSDPVSFEPGKLVGYVKALAQFPNGEVDKLEFVTAQAQLLARNRWKGCPRLAEFQVLGTLLFDDAELLEPVQRACCEISRQDSVISAEDNEIVVSTKIKPKRKYLSFGTAVNLRKKQRSLADLLARSCVPVLVGSTDAVKLGSSCADDVKRSNCKGDNDSRQTERTCRDGDCYHPEMGHLNGIISNIDLAHGTSQTTTLKHGSKHCSARTKAKSKFLSGSCYGNVPSPMEILSTDEVASQLWSIARDPINGCCSVETIRSFFTEFRNYVHPKVQELNQPFIDGVSDDAIHKDAANLLIESPEFEPVQDSYWTDMIIQSIPWEQSAAHIPSFQMQHPLTTKGQLEDESYDDSSVTALILNFTSSKSLPAKKELNNIFVRFGPLKKSKTKVLKKSKRAQVVFCRRADAEAAFSSAGKYSIFGPSLASYRLKYDC